MATQVTQCPMCQTSFRVTEAQLTIANGAVRCGSCLHIFNAPDHWLDAHSQPPQESSPTTNPITEEPTGTVDTDQFNDTFEQTALDTIFDDDFDSLVNELSGNDGSNTDYDANAESFTFNSNMDTQLAPIQPATSQSVTSQPTQANEQTSEYTTNNDDDFADTVAAEYQNTQQTEAPDNDDAKLIHDFSLDEQAEPIHDNRPQPIVDDNGEVFTIEDPDLEGNYDNINDTGAGFSNTFLDLEITEEESTPVFKDLDDIGEDSISEEDEWARKLLEEEDDPLESSSEPSDDLPDAFNDLEEENHHSQTSPESLDNELLDLLDEQDKTLAHDSAHEDEFVLGHVPMTAGQRIGDDNLALLANIEPEPVEITRAGTRNRWAQKAWAVSIIAATLLLGAQYITFNFDRISRDNDYRPLLATICSTVGCQLPSLDDVRLIRSSNLMVRSHPETEGALGVDAIISNRASFKQQFPIVELQFTDLSGNKVAGRQFKPEEYLAGELLGSTLMPIKQPIHISLNIVDPGEQAVNYQLRLHPQKDH